LPQKSGSQLRHLMSGRRRRRERQSPGDSRGRADEPSGGHDPPASDGDRGGPPPASRRCQAAASGGRGRPVGRHRQAGGPADVVPAVRRGAAPGDLQGRHFGSLPMAPSRLPSMFRTAWSSSRLLRAAQPHPGGGARGRGRGRRGPGRNQLGCDIDDLSSPLPTASHVRGSEPGRRAWNPWRSRTGRRRPGDPAEAAGWGRRHRAGQGGELGMSLGLHQHDQVVLVDQPPDGRGRSWDGAIRSPGTGLQVAAQVGRAQGGNGQAGASCSG
jgi:hypothetical protein